MTTITGFEIIDVLKTWGELEWVRCKAADGKDERLSRPPFSVWRYKQRHPELESSIVKAVESFQGNVEWEIKFTGKNWVIAPQRLHEIQEVRGYRTDGEALRALAKEDPEFGKQANYDVPALANKIKETVVADQKVPSSSENFGQ